MKVIIECTPKEIAALVLELQERQGTQCKQTSPFVTDSGIVLCTQDVIENK